MDILGQNPLLTCALVKNVAVTRRVLVDGLRSAVKSVGHLPDGFLDLLVIDKFCPRRKGNPGFITPEPDAGELETVAQIKSNLLKKHVDVFRLTLLGDPLPNVQAVGKGAVNRQADDPQNDHDQDQLYEREPFFRQHCPHHTPSAPGESDTPS